MSDHSMETHCNYRGGGPLYCQENPKWVVTRQGVRIGYCDDHMRDRVGALARGLDAGEKLIVERTQ